MVLWLAAALPPQAATISETFSANPLGHGWSLFGNTNLFTWNSTNQNLNVTWDSSQTNTYFFMPIGTILSRSDDYSIALDLKLLDVTAGVSSNKASTFELAFGLLNVADATKTNFFRGNGHLSPNLAEFDFFPAAGTIAPTVWPAFWSTNSVLNYSGPDDYTLIDLPVGVVMRITMTYSASNSTLATSITTNGASIGDIGPVTLNVPPSFTDFRVGAFAIESYSDAGQDPSYIGSLLAHGTVDNILITVPPPPVQVVAGNFVAGKWQTTFASRTNWLYHLDRTLDLRAWTPVSTNLSGTGSNLTLLDTNPPIGSAFYRVSARKP